MKKHYLLLLTLCLGMVTYSQNQNVTIDNSFPYYVNLQTLGRNTLGGDTIFISSTRTNPLRFQFTNGSAQKPLVIINKGGQVQIDSPDSSVWGSITFENCRYIKISGAGHPNFKYGIELAGDECGLAFAELSSDCEAEFIKINHNGFYGIMAKKNYDGNPPVPYPVFENLIIHDCFIENVSEGMYLGETKSPGMEFKHVKIYNNIVRNTLRESIQIANMVEDVKIYNNTLLNAGLANITYQTSILQIGDNSVAKVYNNIMIQAPTTAIAVYGKGECSFTNNYLASSMGMFIDNRQFTNPSAPINIKQNYFRAITGNQNIKNYNEINYVTAQDNIYNTAIPFFLNQSGNSTNYTVSNNILTTIPAIEFTAPNSSDYSLKSSNPAAYVNMGAPGGPLYFESVPKKIKVSASMITDLVPGGSLKSPLFLFDEQYLNGEPGVHATSESWKPADEMHQSAYHVVVDLGKFYYLSMINLHDMEGTSDFTVAYNDGTNWITLFIDPCSTYNSWRRNTAAVTTRFLRLTMNQKVFAAVNEIIIYGYPVDMKSEQIIISPEMVTDLVQGGSVVSPAFLFDEQNLDLNGGPHPTSNSWKPDYSMNKPSYHVVVDLGRTYYISEINLHDMNNTQDFTVAYGSGSNWNPLFVYPCSKYNVWSKQTTAVSARYLRFSMYTSVYAAVNEIFIYGYPIGSATSKLVAVTKAETVPDSKSIFDSDKMELYPNPVREELTVTFPAQMIGKNNLIIKDMLGKVVYRKELYIKAAHPFHKLTGNELPTENGIYTLSLSNECGALQSSKFIKTN